MLNHAMVDWLPVNHRPPQDPGDAQRRRGPCLPAVSPPPTPTGQFPSASPQPGPSRHSPSPWLRFGLAGALLAGVAIWFVVNPPWTKLMVHRPLAHVGERGTPHVAQVVVVLPGGAVQLRSETYGEETVLLSGIQCPDPLDSVFWQAARPFLDRWRGRWMQVKPVQMDASGALVASLTEPNGDRVEVQLVQQGWCRWQRATAPSDKELAQAERTAQQASGPIWRDRLAPR